MKIENIAAYNQVRAVANEYFASSVRDPDFIQGIISQEGYETAFDAIKVEAKTTLSPHGFCDHDKAFLSLCFDEVGASGKSKEFRNSIMRLPHVCDEDLFKLAEKHGVNEFRYCIEIIRRLRSDFEFNAVFEKALGRSRDVGWFIPHQEPKYALELIRVVLDMDDASSIKKSLFKEPKELAKKFAPADKVTLIQLMMGIDNPMDVLPGKGAPVLALSMAIECASDIAYSDLLGVLADSMVEHARSITKDPARINSLKPIRLAALERLVEHASKLVANKVVIKENQDNLTKILSSFSFLNSPDFEFLCNQDDGLVKCSLSILNKYDKGICELIKTFSPNKNLVLDDIEDLLDQEWKFNMVSDLLDRDEILKSKNRILRGMMLSSDLGM